MVSQDMGKPAGIAPLQRVQNSFMLLDGKRPMFRRHRCDELCPPYPRYDRFIETGQHGIIGYANDSLVNQPVAAIVRDQILRATIWRTIARMMPRSQLKP
jgi:hypothetical protein